MNTLPENDQSKSHKQVGGATCIAHGEFSVSRLVAYLNTQCKNAKGLARKLYQESIRAFEKLPEDAAIPAVLELADQTLFTGDDALADMGRVLLSPCAAREHYFNWSAFKYAADRQVILKIEQEIVMLFASGHEFLESIIYHTLWQSYLTTTSPISTSTYFRVLIEHGRTLYFAVASEGRFAEAVTGTAVEEIVHLLTDADDRSVDQASLINLLKAAIPLDQIRLRGFFTWKVSDHSVEHLLKSITQQAVVSNNEQDNIQAFAEVREVLDLLSGDRHFQYGFYPMLRLNGSYIFDDPRKATAVHPGPLVDGQQQAELFGFLEQVFRHRKDLIYLRDIAERTSTYTYLRSLQSQGVCAYALLPVLYMGEFVGALEILADRDNSLQKVNLFRIENFLPVLGLLYKRSVDRFNDSLDRVIRDQFTSLQEAVQWRFNEAALNFIRTNDPHAEPEEISFDQVYPLYAAIDIRNSTVNRNAALSEDCHRQLEAMTAILDTCFRATGFSLLKEKSFLCREWTERVNADADTLHSGELAYFLETEMVRFFEGLQGACPDQYEAIAELLSELKLPGSGKYGTSQRKLERSMTTVIAAVNRKVDQLRKDALEHFPAFFEKFRTDGVEYDIYIGQSIAPERPFDQMYIQNLRLLQLQNLVSIAMEVDELRPALEYPIEITQLIFVHPYNIDIRFRRDERRFDVEGAYNIRYHILKKRIDKAVIKGSSERLTCPGKIALVYFSQKDLDEFLVHIRFLQAEGRIADKLEYLELEAMQGVVGLKAIRLTINQ